MGHDTTRGEALAGEQVGETAPHEFGQRTTRLALRLVHGVVLCDRSCWADLTYAVSKPRVREANVKSKAPSLLGWWSFNSNIRTRASRQGMRMSESDHKHEPSS